MDIGGPVETAQQQCRMDGRCLTDNNAIAIMIYSGLKVSIKSLGASLAPAMSAFNRSSALAPIPGLDAA